MIFLSSFLRMRRSLFLHDAAARRCCGKPRTGVRLAMHKGARKPALRFSPCRIAARPPYPAVPWKRRNRAMDKHRHRRTITRSTTTRDPGRTAMFRIARAAFLIAAAALICSIEPPARAQPLITLHGAVQFNDDHAFNKALIKFEELVKQYYGKPMSFVLHRNSELGLEKDYFAYMNQGISVDYGIVSPAHMSTFSKARPSSMRRSCSATSTIGTRSSMPICSSRSPMRSRRRPT
jgi:hypothetical protein